MLENTLRPRYTGALETFTFRSLNRYTARERGWEALSNRDLLEEAERNGYEVLLTSDHSIRYQQNLSRRRIGILVLMHNDWPSVRLKATTILEELNCPEPGEYREVEIWADAQIPIMANLPNHPAAAAFWPGGLR